MITDEQVRQFIAENLNRILDDRDMSRAELARRTGDHQTTINLICNAKHVAGSGVLARIAETLDVSMDRLAGRPAEKLLARAS